MFGKKVKKMRRERTVDNVGIISVIQLDEFPDMVIKRYSMNFASPWEHTGEPAQADEFWLELVEFEEPFTAIIRDISPKIKQCIKIQLPLETVYPGNAFYTNINNETIKFKIKCIFYVKAIDLIDGRKSYALNKDFKVKVDLYHEWREEEIDRFELMEFEE